MHGGRAPAPTVYDCRVCACRARLSFSRRDSKRFDGGKPRGAWTVENQPRLAISYCSRNVSFNFPSTSESPAAIDLPAMSDPHDEDDEDLVEDFVDDAVVTHADPTQADKLALQDTRLRNASEFPGGAPLDPNRVAHP